MKKLKRLLYMAPVALLIAACDNGFEEMNVNPNASTEVVPGFLFTKAQLDAVSVNFTGGAYLTIGGSMQHFATYKEVPAAGDKYFNFSYSTGNWAAYSQAVVEIEQVIDAVADQPTNVNLLSASRIWKAYTFHRLTDLYGDVPYSDAGKALTDKNYSPKYDEQSAIYPDLLKELDESINAFDAAQTTFGKSDLIYGGDIGKWKKFGYSLMLRLGMRLTEVDPAAAKTWVQKAIAGGVITSDADIATIAYVDGSNTSNRNFIASGLMTTDYVSPGGDNVEGGKIAKTFIDHLKATSDPRLGVVAIVWKPSADGKTVTADTSAALQKGMPNAAFNSLPGDFNNYSEPNPATILRYDAPLLVFTSAEAHLLLAEAAVRGWYTGATATEEYNLAVTAGLKQWSAFGAAGVISDAKIAAYLKANPYKAGTVAQQMEQIQTQKWVTLFLEDEYEIFANWRRTGYPKLTPTNYPGNLTGGKIPTRFVIPDSEELYNQVNFYEARTRQGGTNTLSSMVWWDK
ncbi:SusD/RagB family nutrient-binding outer membrane lipoprotein [Dyadobacter sp. CY326]|uniref:SusD/RagB family nutrient-binding outer membrane lipoprotein n=1 Tax=Dyadobacter sp. CY326 TaxID=2907300 RepID=UPI001F4437B1|nr:SusD/RagB family nutrient-binding outer membrane lipoprotein [Dyadobacter sp. CY326]MCE7063703.1 SusD/RagB family nutrient-binding outer membrane lipoprotein [Dyadobacter sp. CY326]